MAIQRILTRSWTRAAYERLVDAGLFRPGDAVELIGGELIASEPQGSGHFTAVGLAQETLRAVFGPGWVVRSQGPVALDDQSEPEPDVAVVAGTLRDYRDAHPASPVLVVEVAESSLAIDRGSKASLYARAGVPDYWILNLVDRVLEVHRQPVADPAAPFGWRYGAVEVLGPDASVSPLAVPGRRVIVADLLP